MAKMQGIGKKTDRIAINELNSSNISKVAFQINRANITYTDRNNTRSFVANMKHDPDRGFLISARTIAGIEAARVLIIEDTIKINDRINRIYYWGTTKDIVNLYNLDLKAINIVLGFVIGESDNEYLECNANDFVSYETVYRNLLYKYEYDCETGNIASIRVQNQLSKEVLEICYANYIMLDKYNCPLLIEMKNETRKVNIKIEIERIEARDMPRIRFSQGINYDIRRLR